MSTVPFSQPLSAAHQPVGKTLFTCGPAGANTRSPNVVLVRGVASLVLMLADIAIAVHEGRQQRACWQSSTKYVAR